MSRLLLRAVVLEPEPAVDGLVWLAADGLGAWASPWEGGAEPTRERLLEHHRLVAAVHERADCLPVRFGTVAEDAAPLNARREALLAALARVRGKTELALTLAWDSPLPLGEDQGEGVPGGGEGTRFLAQRARYWGERARREALVDRLAEELRAELGLPPGDLLVRRTPNDRVALSLAALVPRPDADRLKALLARPRGTLRVVVNGPWPPYSFAAAP